MLHPVPSVRWGERGAVSSHALGSAPIGSSSVPPGSSIQPIAEVSVSLVKGLDSKCHGPGLLPWALSPFKTR